PARGRDKTNLSANWFQILIFERNRKFFLPVSFQRNDGAVGRNGQRERGNNFRCCSLLSVCAVDAAELRRFLHDNRRPLIPHFCADRRSEEHTSELQSRSDLVCRLL